jgi:hypothetical protein
MHTIDISQYLRTSSWCKKEGHLVAYDRALVLMDWIQLSVVKAVCNDSGDKDYIAVGVGAFCSFRYHW